MEKITRRERVFSLDEEIEELKNHTSVKSSDKSQGRKWHIKTSERIIDKQDFTEE